MFGCISFCVGDKSIEINGKAFSLGDITVEFLNFPKEKYTAIRNQLEHAQNMLKKYFETKQISDWFEANEEYIKLDSMVCEIECLKLIKENTDIFAETRALTSQIAIFEDNFELTTYDLEIQKEISDYEDYLQHPENYGNYEKSNNEIQGLIEMMEFGIKKPPIPKVPRPKTNALLIYPGNIEQKVKYYMNYCKSYAVALYEIEYFNNTIFNFINYFLSRLKKLDSNNSVLALEDFFNHPRADKLIANPLRGSGWFTFNDHVTLQHIPRETYKGSGIYKIYQYYEVENLQALLKMDFYKSLESGYIIRKCEYCGRYFLLKKGYKTKYCDNPAPDNPKYTCAQLGYRRKGIKELQANNPKAQSLRRCYQRIEKDFSRKIITSKECDKLHNTAQELYYNATVNSGTTNEEFEKQLASENLYSMCNIVRKTNPRGRPKSK